MTEKGDQVQKLLAALARHADLVAEAFDGSVETGDRQRNAGIDALAAVNALKPYDEDSYRLNPRLRDFIADHLLSYKAYAALTRLAGPISQARQQWAEMRRNKVVGSMKEVVRLERAFDETVVDIAYSIERNLGLLQSMVSTQYGNVATLESKLNQNRYYAREVTSALKEIDQVDSLVLTISDEAIGCGLPHIRQLVTRRLGSKLLQWSAHIKDAQATISKRLFDARLMEQRLKRLARYALWLSRNKTSDGWDVEVPETADVALFRPKAIPIRLQPHMHVPDKASQDVLLSIIAKLPPKPTPSLKEELEPKSQLVVSDEMEESDGALQPHEVALEYLLAELALSPEPISLLAWRDSCPELGGVAEESWLIYASSQLQGGGYAVRFLHEDALDPFPINESFYDVEVKIKQGRVN